MDRAVVAGGSIAGLLAARVLTKHFAHVTLVEADQLASRPTPRKGVPQARHAHNLLMRGKLEMERLFPGLEAELLIAGASLIAEPEDVIWYNDGGWRAMPRSDAASLAVGRPLLETAITARLRQSSNLTILEHTRAAAPIVSDDGAVCGLQTTGRDGQSSPDLHADLVVDATGRGSAMPRWLETLGYNLPTIDRLASPVTYASAIFERNPAAQPWGMLLITGAPAHRSGFLFPLEDGRWLASVGAMFSEPAPTDHASFLEFTGGLAVPTMREALVDSKPLSDVAQYRFKGSERKRYDRLARFPEGLVVIGDAVCSFNPLLGQGMTVSALEATMLDDMLGHAALHGGLSPEFAHDFFRAVTPVLDSAWASARSEHLRYPESEAERSFRDAPLQRYLARLNRATHRDPRVTDAFLQVINFMAPPATLLSPTMMARVILMGGT